MRKAIFVTGTSTGVGKTLVAASIAYMMRNKHIDVAVNKPFATAKRRYSRRFKSEDTFVLASAAKTTEKDEELNPCFYPLEASPYMAAKLCKMPYPNLRALLRTVSRMSERHEFLVVEGIGGIMVPLTRNETVATFASKLGFPVLIVTTPVLGSLNHTFLTVQACRLFGLDIAGLVVNNMPEKPTRVESESPKVMQEITGERVLAIVQKQVRPSIKETAKVLEKSRELTEFLIAN